MPVIHPLFILLYRNSYIYLKRRQIISQLYSSATNCLEPPGTHRKWYILYYFSQNTNLILINNDRFSLVLGIQSYV